MFRSIVCAELPPRSLQLLHKNYDFSALRSSSDDLKKPSRKMSVDDASSVLPTHREANTRTVSEGSMSSSRSSEQLALMGLAHRLCTVSTNNDSGVVKENDVMKEAELLMSLSCIPFTNCSYESGRMSPPSDGISCHSSGSGQREAFRFTCPSLSLENHSQELGLPNTPSSFSSSTSPDTSMENAPAALLGRVLKVEDRDALRLSSEAMARNIMQSYEKAIQWRIKSWINCLSRVLVNKERELKSQGIASDENLGLLCESSEAVVITRLRDISEDIRVVDACNNFNLLPQRVYCGENEHDSPAKRQSTFDEEEDGLKESEYEYTVSHLLSFECELNIHAPVVGHAAINLQVPGTMTGTFLSLEDGREHLADVVIDLNTDILASMIEKSSRLVVRSTVEALFKEEIEANGASAEEAAVQEAREEDGSKSAASECPKKDAVVPSSTPRPTYPDERVSGHFVITPRDSSSPSSFGDSDNEERPVILSIPDNFSHGQPKPILAPQPKRGRDLESVSSLNTRLPPMKKSKCLPNVVTPSKTVHQFVEGKQPGPNLPTLVEVALQLHAK